jgi:protein-tyrosine phosphatase
MIDLHTHILPGIDDGPEAWSDSLALARALVEAGVTEVSATSHIKPPHWLNEPSGLAALREQLIAELAEQGLALEIHPGAEHWWCGEVLDSLQRGGGQPYGQGRAFLVEIHPPDRPTMFAERLFALRRSGLLPVLAHVERYALFDGKAGLERLEQLVAQGIVAQINLGSLARGFGWSRGGNAKKFLKAGLVGLVCGDCHRASDVEIAYGRGLDALRSVVGDGGVAYLMQGNPGRLLRGLEVDPWRPV